MCGPPARFLTEDSQGFSASPDFYVYTDNNAVNWNDPSGFDKASVCCQPLRRHWFLKLWRHCFIRITDDDGKGHPRTWGVLGDENSSRNQMVRFNDPRNSDTKNCKPIGGKPCQIQKLEDRLPTNQVSDCPSCGNNYRAWIATDLLHFFDGYNSNTWVFNTIQGAGLTPPPMSRAPGYHPAPGAW